MEKHSGNIPVNANITIDYSKEKPEVKFEYPNKDVVRQNSGSLFIFLLTMIVISLILLGGFLLVTDKAKAPTFCNGTTPSNQTTNFSYAVDFECNNGLNYTVDFIDGFKSKIDNRVLNYLFSTVKPMTSITTPEHSKMLAAVFIMSFGFFVIILMGFTMKFLAWVLTRFKKFNDKVPYINDRLGGGKMYYKKFESVGESKVLEVPLFHNVRLDYHAHGEFSDYLTRVEIKNSDFDMMLWDKKKKIPKKIEKNFVLFSCKFYFSEIPKVGDLEVWFK